MRKCVWVLAALLSVSLAVPVMAAEGESLPHVHRVENFVSTETGHSGLCADCGEAVNEAHSFGEGVVTLAPTCQAEGTKTFPTVKLPTALTESERPIRATVGPITTGGISFAIQATPANLTTIAIIM